MRWIISKPKYKVILFNIITQLHLQKNIPYQVQYNQNVVYLYPIRYIKYATNKSVYKIQT